MPSAFRASASAWLLTLGVAVMPCASIAADPAIPPGRTVGGVPVDVSVDGPPVLPAYLPVIDAAATLPTAQTGPLLSRALPAMPRTSMISCDGPDGRSLGAVVPVATDTGQHASGVIVATDRVLTAAHAIRDAQQVLVRRGADFVPATVLLVDPRVDLAVLAVDTGSTEPLRLAGSDPGDAEPVWAVGFPRAQALALSAGVFQQNRDGALHTSAGIDAGQSGGGLLACRQGQYRLAGMLRGYGAYLNGDRYEKLDNHSVSVAASTIQLFLHDRP